MFVLLCVEEKNEYSRKTPLSVALSLLAGAPGARTIPEKQQAVLSPIDLVDSTASMKASPAKKLVHPARKTPAAGGGGGTPSGVKLATRKAAGLTTPSPSHRSHRKHASHRKGAPAKGNVPAAASDKKSQSSARSRATSAPPTSSTSTPSKGKASAAATATAKHGPSSVTTSGVAAQSCKDACEASTKTDPISSSATSATGQPAVPSVPPVPAAQQEDDTRPAATAPPPALPEPTDATKTGAEISQISNLADKSIIRSAMGAASWGSPGSPLRRFGTQSPLSRSSTPISPMSPKSKVRRHSTGNALFPGMASCSSSPEMGAASRQRRGSWSRAMSPSMSRASDRSTSPLDELRRLSITSTADGADENGEAKGIGPHLLVPGGQILLQLRDFAGRLAGGEGRLIIGEVKGESTKDKRSEVQVVNADGSRSDNELSFTFDSVSHLLLPWPLPMSNPIDRLVNPVEPSFDARRSMADARRMSVVMLDPSQLPKQSGWAAVRAVVQEGAAMSASSPAQMSKSPEQPSKAIVPVSPNVKNQEARKPSAAETVRQLVAPGVGRYAAGQELVILMDGLWLDALVVQPPDDLSSTVHKIQAGGTQHNLLLHPWNHAPHMMRCNVFNELWAKFKEELVQEHTYIVDALSGQRLNVFQQCVPLDLEPLQNGGLQGVKDVAELYNWLSSAHSDRRETPSMLSKAARLVSQGPPEEAASRVSKELADRSSSHATNTSKMRGNEALQTAIFEVENAKSDYVAAAKDLSDQQRLDLEHFTNADREREEDSKAQHKQEQEQLAALKKREKEEMLQAQKEETRRIDYEQQRARTDQGQKVQAMKRQLDTTMSEELKAFKEGQFKDADAFKRRIGSKRVEEDKKLSMMHKKEHEELGEQRQLEQRDLEDEQEEERQRMVEDKDSDVVLLAKQREDERIAMEHAQTSRREALTSKKEMDHEEFVAQKAEAHSEMLEEHGERKRLLKQRQETALLQFEMAKKQELAALVELQGEERKKIANKHKEELKKLNNTADRKRGELAAKQEEERKAMFAARRQSASQEKLEKQKEEEKKKKTPQQERDELEAEIKQEIKDLEAKQDLEGQQLLTEQAERGDRSKKEQDERFVALKASQAEEAEDHEKTLEQEIKDFATNWETSKEKLEARHVEMEAEFEASLIQDAEDLEKRRSNDENALVELREENRKKMVTKHAGMRDRLVAKHEADKAALDLKQDERRKVLAASLDEELTTFTAKQEEERSAVMAKQKAEEKALDESLQEETRLLDERLIEQKAESEQDQQEALRQQDANHDQMQNELDASYSHHRATLQAELKRGKDQFLAKQQAERDRMASEFRTTLSRIVERAQNEYNQAVLSKACVLLTGPPAAGKTCLVSQLMMHALNDKGAPFTPIAIKVQQLQRCLLADRAEITMLQAKNQKELEQLDAAQRAEREQTPFDQREALDFVHREDRERLEGEQRAHLQQAYHRSTFANSWNWADAYLRSVHGSQDPTYILHRQALVSRRALLILDGIDEGGAARNEIERHIVDVLAKQGHVMLVTSRPQGLQSNQFLEHFSGLSLQPLTDAQQQHLIERRLSGEKGRSEELLAYVRERVPLDTETGLRMTGNPLMLSMIISLSEKMGGSSMPDTLCALYSQACTLILERSDRQVQESSGVEATGISSSPRVGNLHQDARVPEPTETGDEGKEAVGSPTRRKPFEITTLLEAIFFRAHAAQTRLIEDQHVDAATLELGSPELLATLEWPSYKGQPRVGHVVKLLRGDHAGEHGVLSADQRGSLVNGKTPRNPFKIRFAAARYASAWVRETDVLSSGLDQATFNARFGYDKRCANMRSAVEKLPAELRSVVQMLRARVGQDQLPLLTLLQSEPLLMQSSHLSFQEFYCARALRRGMSLPGEPPWRWSSWWANCLRLGIELGDGFGNGLMRAAGARGSLDLSGQIGGHRPTALAAVGELMLGLRSIDLSNNEITATEITTIARAVKSSRTLTELSLAKNAIGDAGAVAIADVLSESKLISLNLFNTGTKEEGARAFIAALPTVPSLTKLNLQYNALRGDSKKALEAANALRPHPLFLVM